MLWQVFELVTVAIYIYIYMDGTYADVPMVMALTFKNYSQAVMLTLPSNYELMYIT